MQFTELFIRRPVLSSMVSLAIVLIGVIGYSRLAVREFPDLVSRSDGDGSLKTITVERAPT